MLHPLFCIPDVILLIFMYMKGKREGEVVLDSALDHAGELGEIHNGSPDLLYSVLSQLSAMKMNISLFIIDKSVEQFKKSALTGSGHASYYGKLVFFYLEIDILENWLPSRVGKRHILYL
jgi:hypothetical protein